MRCFREEVRLGLAYRSRSTAVVERWLRLYGRTTTNTHERRRAERTTMVKATAKKSTSRKVSGSRTATTGSARAAARAQEIDQREEQPIDEQELERELAPIEVSIGEVEKFEGPLLALRAFVDNEFVTLGVVDASRLPKCRYCGETIPFDRVVMANSRGWEALYDTTRCRRLAASYRIRHGQAVPRSTEPTKKKK